MEIKKRKDSCCENAFLFNFGDRQTISRGGYQQGKKETPLLFL